MKLLLILALVACGSRSPRTPPEKAIGSGELGATCNCGEEHVGGACVEVTCKPGLECGYPCGMKGCDSVCMTHEQFEKTPDNP